MSHLNEDVLRRLKNAGLLSEALPDLGFVSTGSYALNKVITGDYSKGIPIGMITQFHGEAATAKTVFVTHILKEAQAQGYYTMLVDSENAYNPEFAQKLGIDPTKLIYVAPETVEDCFQIIEDTIKEIRRDDPKTPIIIGYDSIAVSPSKSEWEADNYEGHNMAGAIRAKATGSCLRKINPLLRAENVALVIVNQLRSKVGVMYGSPDTMAAGGRSLEYYLGVNLKCISNKTTDLVRDERKNVLGIKGTLRNTKNRVSAPHRECDFELMYDSGLNEFTGVLKQLEMAGLVERNGAWYTICENDKKFQSKDFVNLLNDSKENSFSPIRELLRLSL